MSTTMGALIYKKLATYFKYIVMEVCKVWILFTCLYYSIASKYKKIVNFKKGNRDPEKLPKQGKDSESL